MRVANLACMAEGLRGEGDTTRYRQANAANLAAKRVAGPVLINSQRKNVPHPPERRLPLVGIDKFKRQLQCAALSRQYLIDHV